MAQNLESAKVVSPVHVMTNQVLQDTIGLGSHIMLTKLILFSGD